MRVLSDEDLRRLSLEERSDLARRLAVVIGPLPEETPTRGRRRRLFVNFLALCCLALIPWIVFLALTLPHRYIAGHWTTAWVGLDVAEMTGLAVTAWAGWRRRQIAVVSALVTGTLLVTDAWFDVLTSSTTGALLLSLADAALIELPLAALLLWAGTGLLARSAHSARRLAGSDTADMALRRLPFFAIDDPVGELFLHPEPPSAGPSPTVSPAPMASLEGTAEPSS